MSPVVRVLAAAMLVAGIVPASAQPKPALAAKLESKKLENGNYAFAIEGTTELPAGTRVHAELLYAKQSKAPPRLQREGQMFVVEEVTVDEGEAAVEGGRFGLHCAYSSREPYAGDYVLVLRVPADGQPEDVRGHLARIGEFPEVRVPAKVGDPQQLEAQRRAVSEALRRDLIQIWRLHGEARARFESLAKQDAPAGTAFAEGLAPGWERRLQEIDSRNELRCPRDLYWVEYYGRRYVDLLCKDLREVVKQFRAALDPPAAQRKPLPEVLQYSENFVDTFTMWMEYLQFPMPKDPGRSLEHLAALNAAVREFAAWFDDTAQAPPADGAASRARVQEWQAKILASTAALTQSLSDFDFAPITALTRDTTRIMRDAIAALTAGDAAARERVPEGLGRSLVVLRELEDRLKQE